MADYKNTSSSLSSSSLSYEPIQPHNKTTTDERLEKRRQVEKPIQPQGIMVDNTEKRYCRVDNTEATNQPSVFSDGFPSLEDLICLYDFLPWHVDFNASYLMGDYVKILFLAYKEQAATEERLKKRKQVEEPKRKQGILADNIEGTIKTNSQSSLFNAIQEFLFVDDSSLQAKLMHHHLFSLANEIQNLE